MLYTLSTFDYRLIHLRQENHNYSKPTVVDGQALSPCIIENIRYPRAEFWNQFTSEQNLLIQAPSEIRKEKDLRVGTMLQHTFGFVHGKLLKGSTKLRIQAVVRRCEI